MHKKVLRCVIEAMKSLVEQMLAAKQQQNVLTKIMQVMHAGSGSIPVASGYL